MPPSSPQLADTFRALHHGAEPIILPNAWDAGSARLIESVGAKAIATTSAGVAWAHGYPDGDALPLRLLAATIASIVRAVRVPVSADVEAGYSTDVAAVGEVIAVVIDAGAVGINIEDGDGTPALLCAKIERARREAARLGVSLFINARTDVYLRKLVPPAAQLEETLSRAKRYLAAGADGIFVPGLVDAEGLRAVVQAIPAPINVLARAGLPPLPELKRLGIRRFSIGSGLSQAAYTQAAISAAAFLGEGTSAPLAAGASTYAELNALMTPR